VFIYQHAKIIQPLAVLCDKGPLLVTQAWKQVAILSDWNKKTLFNCK